MQTIPRKKNALLAALKKTDSRANMQSEPDVFFDAVEGQVGVR